MKLRWWTKVDPGLQERIRIIVKLGRRRDRILESPELDLEALAKLVEDYEKVEMACAAAALRRRLEWYRKNLTGDERVQILDFRLEIED